MSKSTAEFVKWMGPLLDCLRDNGGSASPSQASDWIGDKLHIPEEKREESLRSGGKRFHNQVAWARQYLVWEGFIDDSKRGVWILTAAGAKATLSLDESSRLFKKWVQIHAQSRAASKDSKAGTPNTPTAKSKVVAEIEIAQLQTEEAIPPDDVVQSELLLVLQALTPEAFERLCKRLLHEWGFQDVEVTGKSHDGGVDGVGVLKLNPFVSFQVAFQCKRYKGSVSREQVASFRGSAKAGRADKLILLTTGYFSREAMKEAKGDGAVPVELVDGERLLALFQEKQIGLRRKEVFEVDHAFFDQFR